MSDLKVQPVLVFDGGKLSIKRSGYPSNGDGILTFNDDELEWDHSHDTAHIFRFVSIAKSELLAIRDFLNAEFPTEAIGRCEAAVLEAAGEREARHKLEAALTEKDKAMGVLFERLTAAGIDCSDLIS